MLLVTNQFTSLAIPPLPTPDSEPIKPRSEDSAILVVEEGDPGIYILDDLVMIFVVGGWGTIVLKPYQFGWGQQGGNDKLVFDGRVAAVLLIDDFTETNEPPNDKIFVGTSDEVIEPCRHKHPHRPDLVLVVVNEGVREVSDGATRDCDPIYVEGVCRAGHRGVERAVHFMQETVSQADIQALVWPSAVYQHAGGAHVVAAIVFWSEVHTLCVPDLSS